MDRARINQSSRRKRLACAECTRRKIKCDKVLPCRNCRHRGSSCYRSDTAAHSRLPIVSPQDLHQNHHDESLLTGLTGSLTACLSELQETLQAARMREAAPNLNFDDSALSLSAASSPALSRAAAEQDDVRPTRAAAEIEDAATILEFLAWGRHKAPNFDQLVADPNSVLALPPGDKSLDSGAADLHPLRITDDPSSLPLLQLLLPEPATLTKMTNYHCDALLWYHASFHGRIFQDQVDRFLQQHQGRIEDQWVDLQWVALLFAVLAGSMTCAPRRVVLLWGFEDPERATLAQRLFKAALVCLNLADYTARHSLYGIQCIATMTISAHLLGFSNSHSVKLASAVRIAQSLGMHRLGAETDDHPSNRVRKEIGRRLWTELCIQDWFSIPFSESYLIHRRDFNTQKPGNCTYDDGMPAMPDTVPTLVTYHRFLYDIAILMPQLQDDLSASHTLYTQYEHVIRYDTQMRTLVSQHVPPCLQNMPLESSWPRYIPWARHCLAISSAHKIIMIHRKFLWSSFTNPAFTFTRKTCIAAAKTIIREQKQVAEEDGPVLWIYHAFTVAASIILCLDLFFQPLPDSDQAEHRDLICEMIGLLSQNETSMIAMRGVRILRILLQLERGRGNSSSAPNIRALIQACREQEPSKGHVFSGHATEKPSPNIRGPVSPRAVFHSSEARPREDMSDDVYSNFLFPNSRFRAHDSLEDILLLAQNGGS